MKRTIKKWLSLLLTAAMILSLGITAFASEPATTQDVSDSGYAPAGVGDYTEIEESDRTLHATLANEGRLPNDIVRLILPVVGSVSDVFNMYLDPNDLLQASYGQKYGGEEGANPFADEGSHVYFKHAEEDENGKLYSKTSDPLTIVNKSNVDVDVSLDAAFSKGSDEEDYKSFSFVKTESALSDAKGAAMYLELQAVVNTAATENEAASSSAPITGTFEDVDYPVPTAVSAIADPNATLDPGVSFIDSVEWVWSDAADDDIKAALNTAFNGIAYTFAYADGGALSFHGSDTDVTATGGALDGYTVSAPVATATPAPVAANATSAKETVSKTIGGKNTVLATITFNLNREAITAEKDAIAAATGTPTAAVTTVTFSTAAVVSPAQVKATIAKIDGAYNTIWVPDDQSDPLEGEYQYALNDTYAEAEPDMFNSMDFNLVAAINQDKAWTETVSANLSFDVVWTITPVLPQDAVAPSVTVTSAPTAASTSATVVMNVDLGSGSKAATGIKQFRYTNTSNAVTNVAVATTAGQAASYVNGVLTVKTPTAVFNGSNWKVIFTLENGSEFEVPVNIKVKG